MSQPSTATWRITVTEIHPNGTTKQRFAGDCDAYLLAVAKTISGGQLRVFTDHDGPSQHRRTLLKALTTHIHATISPRRGR